MKRGCERACWANLPNIFAHSRRPSELCFSALVEELNLLIFRASALRAIENGANFLAEGFLFSVATALIIGETWRSSRNQSKQRSDVNGSIEELRIQMRELVERLQAREEDAAEERRQYVSPRLPI
jgi:hypothetical protein